MIGEHCGDAMTHKLLDKITQMIIYQSAVRPITKANPSHRLEVDGGESITSKIPISKVPTANINFILDIGEGKVEELIAYTFYWII